ncbi:MAG: hypothetical protein ACPHV3_00005, partial [Vibrio sp.]
MPTLFNPTRDTQARTPVSLKKLFASATLVASSLLFTSFAQAQDYPPKTVHMVAPAGAGGG